MKITACRETFFFSRHQGMLCQWLEVDLVIDEAQTQPVAAEVAAGGAVVETILPVQAGAGTYRVYAPCAWPQHPAGLSGQLTLSRGQETLRQTIRVGSHRPWTVYLLSDACVDDVWAYEDQAVMRRDDAALVLAEMEEAERRADWAWEEQNRYNLVHIRELEYFLEMYPDQADRLAEHIRRGTLALNPVFNMSSTANMSAEEIIRSFAQARRTAQAHGASDRYANLQETPTEAWITASLLAGIGARHLVRSLLPYECPFLKRLQEPPVYQWEGPDGSRVLVRLRKTDYTEGQFVLKGLDATNRALHEQVLPEYIALGEQYGFDAVGLVGCYGDLSAESRRYAAVKCETVRAYNRQGWEYPRLVNASHQMFWDDIDRQIAARSVEVPVFRGDYGTSWESWAICMAKEFAGWREAQFLSAAADSLGAVTSLLLPETWKALRPQYERAWNHLLYLADHAWNGATEGNRVENHRLRQMWKQAAVTGFSEIVRHCGQALAGQVSRAPANSLIVFNSLGWERAGSVCCEVDQPAPAVRDLASGQVLPAQVVQEGARSRLIFVPPAVPSVGYRAFSLVTGPQFAFDQPNWSPAAGVLDGPFYRLEIDPDSGGVLRLLDKTRQKNLVNPASRYRLNEPVYLADPAPPDPGDRQPTPYQPYQKIDLDHLVERRARLERVESGRCGPVFGELRVFSRIGEIEFETTYRLYAALDLVEITNRVRKPVSVEKQELDFAFPFAVDQAQVRYETPGVILDPAADSLPGAGLSVTGVRTFVDLHNESHGVTLAARDSAYFMFGRRTSGEDPSATDASNGLVLALALENCLDWNESLHDQAGETDFTFRFALQGHAGGFRPVEAVRFGWNACHDLLAFSVEPGREGALPAAGMSFASLSPGPAVLMRLKPGAGGGVAARAWECAGESPQAVLAFRGLGRLRSAAQADLLESETGVLACDGQDVPISLQPHGIATIVARFSGE